MVRLFLAHPGLDPHVKDGQGRTPLMLAARACHARLVNWLLSTLEGVNIEQADSNGETLLVHAICSGDAATVLTVLAAGATVDPAARFKDERTLLHYACRYGSDVVASRALADGAEINALTVTGETPLMLVCQGGHVPTLVALAAHIHLHGVQEPEPAGNAQGWRPVHFAAAAGHLVIIQKLQQLFGRINTRFFFGLVHVMLHLPTRRTFVAQRLTPYTPLMLACKNGHVDVIKYLLEDTHRVVRDRDGQEYLGMSSVDCWPLLHWCCEQGYTEGVRVLISPWGLEHGIGPYLNKTAMVPSEDFRFVF